MLRLEGLGSGKEFMAVGISISATKAMTELTKKLGWETSVEWSKEERKEALDEFGTKALAENTNQAAQEGSAVPRHCKEWPKIRRMT